MKQGPARTDVNEVCRVRGWAYTWRRGSRIDASEGFSVGQELVSYGVRAYAERSSGSAYIMPEYERIVSGHTLDRREMSGSTVRLVSYTPPNSTVIRYAMHAVYKDGTVAAHSYAHLGGAQVDFNGVVELLSQTAPEAQGA